MLLISHLLCAVGVYEKLIYGYVKSFGGISDIHRFNEPSAVQHIVKRLRSDPHSICDNVLFDSKLND